MRTAKSIRLLIVLGLIIPATAYALLQFYESRWQRLPVWGPSTGSGGIKAEHTVSDFSLINQEGEMISAAKWKEKTVVAGFFFTHCPSICPAMTTHLKQVSEAFRDDPELQIASFSVDPERDSVTQLRKYAEQFELNTNKWDLLTGDKKMIYRLARNSFLLVATDGDGGPGDFIHSEKLVLLDRQRRIRGYYDGTSDKETEQLLQDIKKLKHEN